MGGPTGDIAPVSIAFKVIGTHKPPHYVKIVIKVVELQHSCLIFSEQMVQIDCFEHWTKSK